MEGLVCKKCEQFKLFNEYGPSKLGKFGYRNRCKSCSALGARISRANKPLEEKQLIWKRDKKKSQAKNRIKNLGRSEELNSEPYLSKLKTCNVCKKELEFRYFYKNIILPDGYCRQCINCFKEKKTIYYEKNRDIILNKRLEKISKDEAGYRRKIKDWQQSHLELFAHHSSLRRALKIKATPLWADLDIIKNIFKEAKRLTIETGISHHVDHIVPLKSKIVCGLHVPNNLRITTASDNMSKSNKFIEDLL